MNDKFEMALSGFIGILVLGALVLISGCGTENRYYGDCNDLDSGAQCSSNDGSSNQDDSSTNTDSNDNIDNSVDDNSDNSSTTNATTN